MSEITRTASAIIADFFHDNFDKNKALRMTREGNPTWSYFAKPEDGAGLQNQKPIQFMDAAAIAPTRAGVQAMQSAGADDPRGDVWTIPWGGLKAGFKINLTDMKLNKRQLPQWLDLQMAKLEGTMRQWGQKHETLLWKNSGRALGTAVFTSASGLLTLTSNIDAINFYKGQMLQISANDGSSTAHTLVAGSGIGYVIGVNENAGTVTVAASQGGSAGAPANWANAATYYLFDYLQFGGTSTPYRIIQPISAWIPTSDPSSTAFNSVDRTQAIAALSGVRTTSTEISGLPIEQRLELLVEKVDRAGFYNRIGGERMIFLSGLQWRYLKNRIRQFGTLELVKDPMWGFSDIGLVTPYGDVKVRAAHRCPTDGAWLIPKNAFRFRSVGTYPGTVDDDGNVMLRQPDDDNFEVRLDGIGSTECDPGACGYTALSTT